jgi:hypothetical protein
MHGLLKQPGYRLYPPDGPEARALLAEQGLGPADLDRALARLESIEGTAVRSIVGINEDGVFGTSREGWRQDLPDAYREPFILLLWVKIHELLGRVPQGSTARFLKDGMLPGDAQGGVAAVVPRLARFSRRCSRELVERAGAGHTRRVGGDQAWTQYAAGPTSSIAR